jgi:hypothetical protein
MFTFRGSYFHHCFLLLPNFDPHAPCIKFHIQLNILSKLRLMPHKLMLWLCILTLLQVPPSPIDASTNLDIAIPYCNLLTLLQVSTLLSFVNIVKSSTKHMGANKIQWANDIILNKNYTLWQKWVYCNWPCNLVFELQWPFATHCISTTRVLLIKSHEL